MPAFSTIVLEHRYLRCVDVPRIAELCHAKGAIVCIDSTFATPINQRVRFASAMACVAAFLTGKQCFSLTACGTTHHPPLLAYSL
jgi:selenocysteine lyase/cysteine desulfurase